MSRPTGLQHPTGCTHHRRVAPVAMHIQTLSGLGQLLMVFISFYIPYILGYDFSLLYLQPQSLSKIFTISSIIKYIFYLKIL